MLFIDPSLKEFDFPEIKMTSYTGLYVEYFSDCFDEEKSDYITFGEGKDKSYHVSSFYLKSNFPRNRFFRIKEAPYNIFAHESLINIIKGSGLTGIRFVDPAHPVRAVLKP